MEESRFPDVMATTEDRKLNQEGKMIVDAYN
jgi:hypothetical protein